MANKVAIAIDELRHTVNFAIQCTEAVPGAQVVTHS